MFLLTDGVGVVAGAPVLPDVPLLEVIPGVIDFAPD
jgi:hypothetical protein